jgi:peptidoglycan/LPS O-acetylase OafA/YrhL
MVVLFALLNFAGGIGLLTVPLQGGLAAAGSMVLFGLCSRHSGAFVPSRAVEFVSYASFAMYLFHRPMLTLAKDVFMPQGFLLQWCYLTLLCLPLIVLVSWAIQGGYDRIVPLRR